MFQWITLAIFLVLLAVGALVGADQVAKILLNAERDTISQDNPSPAPTQPVETPAATVPPEPGENGSAPPSQNGDQGTQGDRPPQPDSTTTDSISSASQGDRPRSQSFTTSPSPTEVPGLASGSDSGLDSLEAGLVGDLDLEAQIQARLDTEAPLPEGLNLQELLTQSNGSSIPASTLGQGISSASDAGESEAATGETPSPPIPGLW